MSLIIHWIFQKWNEKNSKFTSRILTNISNWNCLLAHTSLICYTFFLLRFCLRMKLSIASLAGKNFKFRKKLLFLTKSYKYSYVSGHLFLYLVPQFVCLLQETVSQVKIMLISFSHPYANTCFIEKEMCLTLLLQAVHTSKYNTVIWRICIARTDRLSSATRTVVIHIHNECNVITCWIHSHISMEII